MNVMGAYLGAGLGIGMRLWANNLGKQHALARPWNYVGVIVVGSYVGYNYTKWENELLTAVNAKRQEKGLLVITRQQVTDELQHTSKEE